MTMPLSVFNELADILERTLPPVQALQLGLQIMNRHLPLKKASIALMGLSSGNIKIHASLGLTQAEQDRGHYLPGEGIIGKVIASGKAEIIPDISENPQFLNRTRSRNLKRERTAFICVPIRFDDQVIGALTVDRHIGAQDKLLDQMRILTVIAMLMSHTANMCRIRSFPPQKTLLGVSENDSTYASNFIGKSEKINIVLSRIRQVASSSATVLLRGESGTGKEVAAHAIHELSERKSQPFIALNCAALPDSLIESELFGHERGSFTGASSTRRGRFELANRGTLFLDEIGELSLHMQAKLLRVIQERSFERLGGTETIHVDVRLIAATNKNIEKMLDEGTFRKDLYYRIDVFPISIPPLRDRKEDILSLAAHFIALYSEANHKTGVRLSMSAMDMLQKYSWPGNVRELQNVIERAVLLVNDEGLILPLHLPQSMHSADCPYREENGSFSVPAMGHLQQRLDEMEQAYIIEALSHSHGHLGNAAEALGLTERMMALRMKKYDISYKSFRLHKKLSS